MVDENKKKLSYRRVIFEHVIDLGLREFVEADPNDCLGVPGVHHEKCCNGHYTVELYDPELDVWVSARYGIQHNLTYDNALEYVACLYEYRPEVKDKLWRIAYLHTGHKYAHITDDVFEVYMNRPDTPGITIWAEKQLSGQIRFYNQEWFKQELKQIAAEKLAQKHN